MKKVNIATQSIIVVLLILLLPGIIGYTLNSIGLLTSFSYILAILILIFPIVASCFFAYKAVQQFDFDKCLKLFLGCLALVIFLCMLSGRIGLIVALYFTTVILYSFTKQ